MAKGRTDRKNEVLQRASKFTKKLREQREKKKMSQRELADASGVSVDVIRSIENGFLKVPNVIIAADLVKALKGDLIKWVK